MKNYTTPICILICLTGIATVSITANPTIQFSKQNGSLQATIENAPTGSTVVCDRDQQLVMSQPVIIDKSLTLQGLNARLPKKLGRTSLIEVTAENVTLIDLELHGNYNSVDQADRAPLINIEKGGFRVERCKFYDSSKDGVQISPVTGAKEDIVGGIVKNIEGFRLGRDAVSISGGIEGRKIRNVTVENVSLKKGYYRGAVEVSDGTDHITVRNIYAEECLYAIDVQDHRRECASNTNVTIENVTAVNCKHVLRTANSPREHAGLTLQNLTGIDCEAPLYIRNTEDVSINGLNIQNHRSKESPPISFQNCQDVALRNVKIESIHFKDHPIKTVDCTNVMKDI